MPKSNKRRSRNRNRKGRKGGCGELGGCMLIPHVNNTTASDQYGMAGGSAYDGKMDAGGAVFPASFQNVPIRSFYPENDMNNDPNYSVVNSRNTAPFFTGGKRSRRGRRKSAKKSKSMRCKSCGRTPFYPMKGGDGNLSIMNGLANWASYIPNPFMPAGLSLNTVNSIGDVAGVSNVASRLTTNTLHDPAQTPSSMYHSRNVPLA